MKALVAVLAAVAMSLVISQCSSNPTSNTDDTGGSSSIRFVSAKNVSRETAPGVSDVDKAALVKGNTAFAFDLYKQIAADAKYRGKNLFISPYSVSVALAMTLAGAEGETETQMHEALRFALVEPNLHKALNGLDLDMETAAGGQDNLTLSVVNALWGQYNWNFRVSFLYLLARNYGAGMNLLDFAADPDGSRITINQWVEGQTEEKIKDLLPPGSVGWETKLVLTNAIYFFADWLKQFDPALTEESEFTSANGEVVRTPFMALSGPDEEVKVLSAVTDKSKAVELPYAGNRFAMLAVMPKTADISIESFEDGFDTTELNAVITGLDSAEIKVKLPRFTFGTPSVSLKEPLQNLGMRIPFTGSADFSGIDSTGSLVISDVFHKAFIAVDEQGTEAVAATAVVVYCVSMPFDPNFIADRPFIYFIRDRRTGAILFMGRVMDPTDTGEA
ncbi:MAG: serpin family protein [Chitinivibrionales bacterium]|nr:serpin family protein [Chitinivibrionales bacterium]MBD3357239.1 serpin family protein [Chitinivibrionales bacterium]